MTTLEQIANSINYTLLREQKTELVTLVLKEFSRLTEEQMMALEGILSIIDNLQDTIVEAGIKTEEEVFGKI